MMATFHQIWPIPFHVLIHTRNKVRDFKQQNRWQNVVDITHRILKWPRFLTTKPADKYLLNVTRPFLDTHLKLGVEF